MADNQYKEVLIVLVACIVLFLILAAIILFFFFLYQRRRYQQQRQMAELQLQFREQSLKAQLEIQETTFHAISQEIHDNVGQLLSLAKVQINIMDESQRLDEELMDIAMPEMDGYAATAWVRDHHPDIKVLALSWRMISMRSVCLPGFRTGRPVFCSWPVVRRRMWRLLK